MTYSVYEISEYSGHPIELYEFKYGAKAFRYTSFDQDVLYNGQIYSATTIKRSGIDSSQEFAKATLTFNMPRDELFPQQFISTAPANIIQVTIQRFHNGDTSGVVTWKGRVNNVSFEENEATIDCSSVISTLKRPGLRRTYQKQCPHILYGTSCGLSRSVFSTFATIATITGNVITSSVFSLQTDGYYTGGMVEYNDPDGVVLTRFITDHVGTTLTLNIVPTGMSIGDTVTAAAGCDHTPTTCKTKFSNLDNYGGWPYIPQKNPMDGTPIF